MVLLSSIIFVVGQTRAESTPISQRPLNDSFDFDLKLRTVPGIKKCVSVSCVRQSDGLTDRRAFPLNNKDDPPAPTRLFGCVSCFANSVNFVESVNETRLEHLHVDIGFQSNDFGGQRTGPMEFEFEIQFVMSCAFIGVGREGPVCVGFVLICP